MDFLTSATVFVSSYVLFSINTKHMEWTILKAYNLWLGKRNKYFVFVLCFLLGDSPASEFYMPTFRNTLSFPSTRTYLPMKMEQSVPKRRHIKFRRRGIAQQKSYNIQDKAKFWNQEYFVFVQMRRTIFASSQQLSPSDNFKECHLRCVGKLDRWEGSP